MTSNRFARRAAAATPCAVLVLMTGAAVAADQQPAQPETTAQARAPIDLTGYWVSVVTEDWRWRMVTPPKGDYASVPLNAAGRKAADTWDLAKDVAQGNQCRPFGVGGLMRMPGRLHITWQDPNTLKVNADAGTQTRLLHFDSSLRAPAQRTWQGWSIASWDNIAASPNGPPRGGSLKVMTSGMRSGYLRKNGVPYSDNMMLTEYFDITTESNGDQWLTVTTMVDDPMYLTQGFVTTSHFKKEPDGSKWHPTPCETAPPLAQPVKSQ